MQYTTDDRRLVAEVPPRAAPGRPGDVSGLQPRLLAESAVEGHEGAARARRRARAAALFDRRVAATLRALSRTSRSFRSGFPVKSRLHKGWKAAVFNGVFVGTFNALPRAWVRRFGWHLLAFCTEEPERPVETTVHAIRQGSRLRQRLSDRRRRRRRRARRSCRRSRGACATAIAASAPTASWSDGRRPDRPRPCGCSMPTAATRNCRATACAALRPGWRTSAASRPARPCQSRPTRARSTLTLLQADGTRYQFRAAMGQPEQLRQERFDGRRRGRHRRRPARRQSAMRRARTGHRRRLHRIAAALAVHPFFPGGYERRAGQRSRLPIACAS